MKTRNPFATIIIVLGSMLILASCNSALKKIPDIPVRPSTNGCTHDLFFYNLSSTGYFTSIRAKALGKQTEFMSAGADDEWNTSFSPYLIEWTNLTDSISTGLSFSSNFYVEIKPQPFGGQKIRVEWLNNGSVVSSKIMDTPCQGDGNIVPYIYDFSEIESSIKEKVTVVDSMLAFQTFNDVQDIYEYLNNEIANEEFMEFRGNEIDSLFDEPLLANFSQLFPNFTSLYEDFTLRNAKLEESGEYEPETGWPFLKGFFDDEENAILSKNRSIIVADKVYYFDTPDKVIEFSHPSNSIALFKEYQKLNSTGRMSRSFIEKNKKFIKEINTQQFDVFERKNRILHDLLARKEGTFEGVAVAGSYIPVLKSLCEEDDIEPEVHLISNDCAKYTFEDKTNYAGCECTRKWYVKQKKIGVYLVIAGPMNINSNNFTFTFPETDNYRVGVETECSFFDTTYVMQIDSTTKDTIYVIEEIVERTEKDEDYLDIFVEVTKADFSYEIIYACSLKVQFTNKSSPNATKYTWAFASGDPFVSSSQNQIVRYTSPGTYKVILTVEDADGCSDTEERFIEVKNPCTPDFEISYTCKQPGQRPDEFFVTFINKSTGASCPGTKFTWDFGDGTTRIDTLTSSGTLQTQFTHTYMPGTYNVTLTMQRSGQLRCNNPITKPIVITNCLPNVNYVVCPNGTVVLSVDINVETIFWDFPQEATKAPNYQGLLVQKISKEPGIHFKCPGVYNGSVTITTENGCTCTVPYTIQINSEDIACCTAKQMERLVAYLDNDLNVVSKNDNSKKYKVIYKARHKKHKIKGKTKFQKKGLFGIFFRHKADEIRVGFNCILYSTDEKSGVTCDCSDDFVFNPPIEVRLNKGLVKDNNNVFIHPINTRTNSFKSTHYVKKGSNTWTDDIIMGESCDSCGSK